MLGLWVKQPFSVGKTNNFIAIACLLDKVENASKDLPGLKAS